ncbi:MAG: undecaprenyldiphospho-muramoylpentapeptide beta-N-acetylglucosaminyltransferase [Deltaproteobacteria bacterium]|nr:undecaprenyldiphospho-muramoylpentapeptide beta-N-acetylglucosaminyltransferase [Deltaproteobacteria bacterium]
MRIIIGGGGTGGHLFPALALADEFKRQIPETEIIFVGSRQGLESRLVPQHGYDLIFIHAKGWKGRGIIGKIKSLWAVPVGVLKSLWIIWRFKPDLVIGVGGYASGPVGLAAWMMGKKMALQEQNSIPGLTNRLLGRLADIIFLSFEDQAGCFDPAKTRLVGNPVRESLLRAGRMTTSDPAGRIRLLIMGGSQGAHRINEVFTAAMDLLGDRRTGWRITHQTGEKDFDAVTAEYQRLGLDANVAPFFTDMGQVYAQTDVVLARSGATTLAELTSLRKPAVFIPYPYAANNHQEINARFVSDQGAAMTITEAELTPQLLADCLIDLMDHPEKIETMADQAGRLGRPTAAVDIVRECRNLVGRN